MLLLVAIALVALAVASCTPLVWRSITGSALEEDMRRYRDVTDLRTRTAPARRSDRDVHVAA